MNPEINSPELEMKASLDGIRNTLPVWRSVQDSIQTGESTRNDPELLAQYTREINGFIISSGLNNQQLMAIFREPMRKFLEYMRTDAEARAQRN